MKRVKPGAPLASSGVAADMQALAKAITRLEVKGDDKIDARIDWSNGIPRITITWKGGV